MIKYNTARRNEKNHIIISPEFNIYIFENHYILNEPKIASSYMDRHHKPARANFHNTNFSIIGYQESSGLLMNKGEKETMSRKDFDNWSVEGKDFDKDWNNLLEGNPTSKKFVFLIRNPIQKFISGLVQDYVIPLFTGIITCQECVSMGDILRCWNLDGRKETIQMSSFSGMNNGREIRGKY